MILKIVIPKSLEKLALFNEIFLKRFKMGKMSKIDQKTQKIGFFNSKFEFLVIFGPFNPFAKFF